MKESRRRERARGCEERKKKGEKVIGRKFRMLYTREDTTLADAATSSNDNVDGDQRNDDGWSRLAFACDL